MEACSTCGHERTLGRCWRLTCPTNGARESFEHVRSEAKAASVAAGGRDLFASVTRDDE